MPRIQHTTDGEPVSAAVDSRPTRQLESAINQLKGRVDAMVAGRGLVYEDAPLDASVLSQHAVYWDSVAGKFKSALAAVADTGGRLEPAASAIVAGLVTVKTAPTRGTVLLHGLHSFADLSNAITGTPQHGWYYLSARDPGKLTRVSPPFSVPVCHVYGALSACHPETQVYVAPQYRNFTDDHVHHSVELIPRASGDAVLGGSGYSISSPVAGMPGWLPANHAVFEGRAPQGAHFGYNWRADPNLRDLWPPVPAQAALLEVFREGISGGRVRPDLVTFDRYGIWWYSDCIGEVPWDYDSTSSIASQASTGVSCAPDHMRLLLSLVKMSFAADGAVVTSLQADENQPLAFVDCNGLAATSGDLRARLALSLLVASGNTTGYRVLKTIGADNKFSAGYVAEGIVSESPSLTIASSATTTATINNQTATVHHGVVRLAIQPNQAQLELSPQIVKLDSTLIRAYQDVPYFAFPPGRSSTLLVTFNIPTSGLPANPVIVVKGLLLGLSTGTTTDMSCTYQIVSANTLITSTQTDLALVTNIAVTAGTPKSVTSGQLAVQAGTVVAIRIHRDVAGTPSYAAEMGLVRITAVLQQGA